MKNPSYTAFEYIYRDASNYKAFGTILATGGMTKADIRKLIDCFEDYNLFVAEQVGIPVLYEQLYQYSDGPTDDDHVYHEFLLCRTATMKEVRTLSLWGSTQNLLATFQKAKGQWNLLLSPHADPYGW